MNPTWPFYEYFLSAPFWIGRCVLTTPSNYVPTLWTLTIYTLLHNKSGRRCRALSPSPPPRIFERRTNLNELYITGKGIYWRVWLFSTLTKYIDLTILWAILVKLSKYRILFGSLKNIILIKHKHVIYHFKASDLEITMAVTNFRNSVTQKHFWNLMVVFLLNLHAKNTYVSEKLL